MLLENKYYKVERFGREGNVGVFDIALLPECSVYDGHFPGNPVCPGVCNIETIRECAMLLTGKRLTISTIRQCRFNSLITPCEGKLLTVEVSAVEEDGKYLTTASVYDKDTDYLTFKGCLIPD